MSSLATICPHALSVLFRSSNSVTWRVPMILELFFFSPPDVACTITSGKIVFVLLSRRLELSSRSR